MDFYLVFWSCIYYFSNVLKSKIHGPMNFPAKTFTTIILLTYLLTGSLLAPGVCQKGKLHARTTPVMALADIPDEASTYSTSNEPTLSHPQITANKPCLEFPAVLLSSLGEKTSETALRPPVPPQEFTHQDISAPSPYRTAFLPSSLAPAFGTKQHLKCIRSVILLI